MPVLLLPGDPVPGPSTAQTVRIGPGLRALNPTSSAQEKGKQKAVEQDIVSTRAGLLGHVVEKGGKSESWWIEGQSFRYVPRSQEPVLGIVVGRHADGFRVDIGSSQPAALDGLAFEGATKRNKPNLKIGQLVYAFLLPTPGFVEPEVSCVDPTTQKAGGFGELEGGFLIRGVELGRCRMLLQPKNPVLKKLGSKQAFELAIGMNGRIWVKLPEGDEDKLAGVIEELKGSPI